MSNDNPTSFTKAYEELKKLASDLEDDQLDLEKAIPKFRRASTLSHFLKDRLNEIENEIKEISLEELDENTSKTTASSTQSDDIDF